MKLIHVTDTHLIHPGKTLHGLDPEVRFEACMEDIILNHSDADCLLITGDLADKGEASAYELMAKSLNQYPVPAYLVLGNHDDREVFAKYFPRIELDENGFVQYEVNTPEGIFLILDTLEKGTDSGIFCEKRLKWLKKKLEEHENQTIYLFMHHPPFDLHFPCIDRIGLKNKEGFHQVIQNHMHSIRHLFFGHAHRPLSGNWQGISFSSLRGTNHQVKLDFNSQVITALDEPPEYSVVFMTEESVVVHSHCYPL